MKTTKGVSRSLLIAGILAFGTGMAAGASVFNTGVLADGSLASTGSVDLHYTDTAGNPVYVESYGYGLPPDAISQWIGPDSGGGAGNGFDGGVYSLDYRTSFNLGSLDPATASLTGQWATDNSERTF